MKRIFTGMALLSGMVCFAQDKLEINAEIDGLKENDLVIFWRPLGNVVDSAFVKNGKFSKTLDMKEGGSTYIIQIGREKREEQGTFLYLEGGKLNIKGKGPYFTNAVYSGSQFVNDWQKLEKDFFSNNLGEAKIAELEGQISEATRVGDVDAQQELNVQLNKITSENSRLAKAWLLDNPNAGAGSYLINAYMSNAAPGEITGLLDKLGPNVRNTFTVKYMLTQMTGTGTATFDKIGKPAPGFRLKDDKGNTHNLADFKGQYVLIDFWASWCKPCREQNPLLIKLNEQYKNKGLSIVSISIDEDNAKWLKAVAEDKLTWPQLIGESGPTSQVAKDYNVVAIPATMLIDKQGNLLKIGLRGAELEEYLRKLL